MLPTLAEPHTGAVLHLKYNSVMANIDTSAEASSSDIQAVARVGQICSLFGPHTSELTAADVADRLGLNRTTAYRYCASLVTAGILERGPKRGTFILGGLMLQLGIHALGRRRVVDLAPPYLARLSTDLGMTAVLGLWGARGPVVALVQEDVRHHVVVTVHAGTQLDFTAAQARVFLAHHTDELALARIAADATAAQRAELEAGVHAARRDGYSIVDHSGGLFGAAAPVFDEYGICATIGLIGAGQRVDFAPDSLALSRLLTTAAALSDELSGAGDRERFADL